MRLLKQKRKEEQQKMFSQRLPFEIVIASYNIHRSIGVDRKLAPERIRRVIHECDADIIALQEVDSGIHSDGGCQVEFFRSIPGYTLVEGPTIVDERGKYGNVLLSRLPVHQSSLVNLAVGGREPRGAIAADLVWHDQIFRVVALHLGLRAYERSLQYDKLNAVVDGVERPLLVCGDFNEWKRYPRAIHKLPFDIRQQPKPKKTFPSRFPVFPLDRIFAEPEEAILAFAVHHSPLTRVASDHLPVKALVDLRVLCAKGDERRGSRSA